MREELKTAKDWFSDIHEPYNVTVYDYDGFNRENFVYSWNEELISKTEYLNRICECTVGYGK